MLSYIRQRIWYISRIARLLCLGVHSSAFQLVRISVTKSALLVGDKAIASERVL